MITQVETWLEQLLEVVAAQVVGVVGRVGGLVRAGVAATASSCACISAAAICAAPGAEASAGSGSGWSRASGAFRAGRSWPDILQCLVAKARRDRDGRGGDTVERVRVGGVAVDMAAEFAAERARIRSSAALPRPARGRSWGRRAGGSGWGPAFRWQRSRGSVRAPGSRARSGFAARRAHPRRPGGRSVPAFGRTNSSGATGTLPGTTR